MDSRARLRAKREKGGSVNFRLKTKVEVEELVEKMREIPVDEDVSEICGLGDELVALLRSQPTQQEALPEAPDLTTAEAAASAAEIHDLEVSVRLFDCSPEELPANEHRRALFLEQKREELEKVLGAAAARKAMAYLYGAGGGEEPVRLTCDTVYNLRRSAAIGKLPGRTRDLFSEAMLKALDEHGGDLDVDLAQFVRAFCANDERSMRGVARRLASA